MVCDRVSTAAGATGRAGRGGEAAMASNAYHFITHWRVQGTVDEVGEVLKDPADLVRWWPSVYLDVRVLEPGDERGLGKVAQLYTKGRLPYTLRWSFRVTEIRRDGFSLEAWGDFDGRGIWTFAQDGPWVAVTYDWKINAEKPLLKYGSFLMKPIFAANHRWAMARGEESLRLELARRRAATAGARARIPAPPGPTAVPVVPLLVGTGAVGALAAALVYVVKSQSPGR
jgi:hypothetical protein